MEIQDSNNQKYASYKNNLIFESIISTPDRDRFYGLSREHIELTLGIKIPLLLESIDFKLEDKILREQYLFEQWAQSLRAAAGVVGGALKTAATKAAAGVTGALGKVRDTAGIFKALSLIIQYPTLVQELAQSLTDQVNTVFKPTFDFLGLVLKWVKDKAQKVLVAINTAFSAANTTLKKLLDKFNSLGGWQKVALGSGLAILGAWVSSIIGPKIEILTGKLTKAIGEVASAVAGGIKKVAGAASDAVIASEVPKEGEAGGMAAAAKSVAGAGAGAVGESLTELGKQLLPELQGLVKAAIAKLGLATTAATLSAFTGPIGPFLLSVVGIVGKASLIVSTLSPITNKFIDKYNVIIGKNQPAGVGPTARTATLGPSTTPTFVRAADAIGRGASAVGQAAGAVRSAVGLEEHRVLLRDIIYE